MARKGVLKAGVLFLLVFLLAASISYAEKFTARNGELERAANITGFADERTYSVLKADLRDGHGRIYLIVNSKSTGNDNVRITMDLRNPLIINSKKSTGNYDIDLRNSNADYSQIIAAGYAKVEYKITNNGYFVVDPVPDERGYFHKTRIGQKEPAREKAIEYVTINIVNDLVDITSESFEIRNLELKLE